MPQVNGTPREIPTKVDPHEDACSVLRDLGGYQLLCSCRVYVKIVEGGIRTAVQVAHEHMLIIVKQNYLGPWKAKR